MAFKGKWKFPEPRRGSCEDVSEKAREGPLKGSFPNPGDPSLGKGDNTSHNSHVLYRL